MSDTSGADNTEIGDITIFDSSYFDQDYKLKPIWLGLLWWFTGIIPVIFFRAARPGWSGLSWGLTTGEWHAWSVMMYATGSVFGAMGTFWLLAYIKRDNRIFQKIYYRTIAGGIPLTWVLALWTLIAFIVGGTQVGGNIGVDIGYGLGWWVLMGGLEALAWYLAPGTVKFYKWDQQTWWNYDSDDVPAVWPSQLGDFIDY